MLCWSRVRRGFSRQQIKFKFVSESSEVREMAKCRPDSVLIYTSTEAACHLLVPLCSLWLLHLSIRAMGTFGISWRKPPGKFKPPSEARWPWAVSQSCWKVGRALPQLLLLLTCQWPHKSQSSSLGCSKHVPVLWHATSGSKFCPNSSHCSYLQRTLEFFWVFSFPLMQLIWSNILSLSSGLVPSAVTTRSCHN